MPIIRECTPARLEEAVPCAKTLGPAVDRYRPFDPVAYEITFSTPAYLAEGVAAMRRNGGRVWVNTLSPHHAAGLVDADALSAPEAVWGRALRLGANMIQTDYPEALIGYLKTSGRRDDRNDSAAGVKAR